MAEESLETRSQRAEDAIRDQLADVVRSGFSAQTILTILAEEMEADADEDGSVERATEVQDEVAIIRLMVRLLDKTPKHQIPEAPDER